MQQKSALALMSVHFSLCVKVKLSVTQVSQSVGRVEDERPLHLEDRLPVEEVVEPPPAKRVPGTPATSAAPCLLY